MDPLPSTSAAANPNVPEITTEATNRYSVDSLSTIGENVTVGDRYVSIDDISLTPDEIFKSHSATKPETPHSVSKDSIKDEDVFARPTPVEDVLSPARMLQFEMEYPNSATPTMKRVAIDFDFFKAQLENYKAAEETVANKEYEETPVIVKAGTKRHDIQFGEIKLKKLRNNEQFINKEISSRLVQASEDQKTGSYLCQKLRICIQRGNTASLLGTLLLGRALDEVFYI